MRILLYNPLKWADAICRGGLKVIPTWANWSAAAWSMLSSPGTDCTSRLLPTGRIWKPLPITWSFFIARAKSSLQWIRLNRWSLLNVTNIFQQFAETKHQGKCVEVYFTALYHRVLKAPARYIGSVHVLCLPHIRQTYNATDLRLRNIV